MTKTLMQDIIDAAGISKTTFARKVGVSVNTVYRWFNTDLKPNQEHQKKIRAVFKKQIAKMYK